MSASCSSLGLSMLCSQMTGARQRGICPLPDTQSYPCRPTQVRHLALKIPTSCSQKEKPALCSVRAQILNDMISTPRSKLRLVGPCLFMRQVLHLESWKRATLAVQPKGLDILSCLFYPIPDNSSKIAPCRFDWMGAEYRHAARLDQRVQGHAKDPAQHRAPSHAWHGSRLRPLDCHPESGGLPTCAGKHTQ